jgi:hypothetical protein
MKKPTVMERRKETWGIMREFGTFTVLQIQDKAPFSDAVVRAYIKYLLKTGYVKKEAIPRLKKDTIGRFTRLSRYTIVKDVTETPPFTSKEEVTEIELVRQQFWNTIRILRRFDMATLWAASGTAEKPVSRWAMSFYVGTLSRSGYLRKGRTQCKPEYTLVRDSGPKAPIPRRLTDVRDPNTNRPIGPSREGSTKEKLSKAEKREKTWELVRELGTFVISEILDKSPLSPNGARAYLGHLLKAGYVKKESMPRPHKDRFGRLFRLNCYTVIKGVTEAPAFTGNGEVTEVGLARQQLWRAIRILRRFDIATLWAASSTAEKPVSRPTAQDYVALLARAGYLKKKGGTHSKPEYTLVRDSGPKAPTVIRVIDMWDPNTKQAY